MATLTTPYPTLVDVLNGIDPNGATARVANVLSKVNPILRDLPMVEGNLPTGHRVFAATALPSPTWRTVNGFVTPSVASVGPFDESCGIMEAHSTIDLAAMNLNGNSASWRAQRDDLYAEAMNQELATGVFYHSTKTYPERFYGLSPRYASQSGTSGSYCLKVGTVSTTSTWACWLVNWQPNRVYCIYPKGSQGGLQKIDRGVNLIVNSSGGQMFAYVTQFVWNVGLAVEDYRYAVRLLADADDTGGAWSDTSRLLMTGMSNMLAQIYTGDGALRFYMSRTFFAKLQAQLINAQANMLQWIDDGGRQIPSFLGVPIRVTDALVTETADY